MIPYNNLSKEKVRRNVEQKVAEAVKNKTEKRLAELRFLHTKEEEDIQTSGGRTEKSVVRLGVHPFRPSSFKRCLRAVMQFGWQSKMRPEGRNHQD